MKTPVSKIGIAAALLCIGMAPVAGASRTRSGAVVAMVCAALVAVGMAAAGAAAPPTA